MNTTYELGDLIMIFIERNYSTNQVMGIYKSYDDELDQVTIYPLTSEGLEIAKFDNNETQLGIHRQLAFTVSGFAKAKTILIENPYLTMDSSEKYYYDQIQSRI